MHCKGKGWTDLGDGYMMRDKGDLTSQCISKVCKPEIDTFV